MANVSGPQPDIKYCPVCKSGLTNVPRSKMKSRGYVRKDDTMRGTLLTKLNKSDEGSKDRGSERCMRGTLLTKLNKSDEGSKDRGSERWEYPPGRGRIIPASQQRPVCG